jgi:hypothetical protein
VTTMNVYPRAGTTYPAEGGGTITAAGLNVDITDYYRRAISAGDLCTYDPTATSDGTTYVPSSGDLTVLNVRSYGAVGDGVADDWRAIQDAINAAQILGGREVWLPGGNYRISQALVITASCNLRGDGQKLTYLSGPGVSATGITLIDVQTSGTGGIIFTQIHGMTLQLCKNGLGISGDGVLGAGDICYDTDFYACYNAGIYIRAICTGGSFRNVRASGCNYGVYANGPTVCNYVTFEQFFLSYLSLAGMYFGDDTAINTGSGGGGGMQGVRIRDCEFDFLLGHGLQTFATTCSVESCYFEQCGLTAGYDVLVESNYTLANPSYAPSKANLINCTFDLPGAGQLVSGTLHAAGSIYNRVKCAMPGAEFSAVSTKLLQPALRVRIDNSTSAYGANIQLMDSGFEIIGSNYLPYGQRQQPGYIGTGVITTYGSATTIGVDRDMASYGGACLVMCTQANASTSKAGVYLLRLANNLGTGFLATFIGGDNIATFSTSEDVPGSGHYVVKAVATDTVTVSPIMQVSVLSTNIGTGVYTGF